MSAPVWSFDGRALRDERGEVTEWPLLAVIGDPIDHSISPVLHRAALEARGIDGEYRAIRVASPDLSRFVGAVATSRLRGLNITLPHKQAVLGAGLERSEECLEIGAANTLVRRGERLCLHNTDSRGFALALDRFLGRELHRSLRRCVLVGAGGAARAVAHALRGLGAEALVVAAREPARAQWAATLGAQPVDLAAEALTGATLVVQCTPLGLRADDPSPIALDALDDAAVVDLTYAATESRFLREARARGCRGMDGRSMLVAQAALAFSMWFGADPPLREMATALELDW